MSASVRQCDPDVRIFCAGFRVHSVPPATLYFTVDDCYRVDFTPHGLALHCLTPHGESLLAYYDSPASVFAAMLAHRTAGGCASLSEYTAEFNRLSAIFSQEWQRVTGYQP